MKNFKKTESNSFSTVALKNVLDITLTDLGKNNPNANWHKLKGVGQVIGSIGMKAHFADKFGNEHHFDLNYPLRRKDLANPQIIARIKKNIYQQRPKEGLWFFYKIILTTDQTYIMSYDFFDSSADDKTATTL